MGQVGPGGPHANLSPSVSPPGAPVGGGGRERRGQGHHLSLRHPASPGSPRGLQALTWWRGGVLSPSRCPCPPLLPPPPPRILGKAGGVPTHQQHPAITTTVGLPRQGEPLAPPWSLAVRPEPTLAVPGGRWVSPWPPQGCSPWGTEPSWERAAWSRAGISPLRAGAVPQVAPGPSSTPPHGDLSRSVLIVPC